MYVAGRGNYIVNLKYNKLKNIITFLLPSRQHLITSGWCIALKGSSGFAAIKNFISPNGKNNLNGLKMSVRGVAKNPVDHHNGGRSKRKPVFLNKYNMVAKFGK